MTDPAGDTHGSTARHARVAAATSTRELVHALMRAEADDATLDAVVALANQAVERLNDTPRRRRTLPDFAALAAMRDAGVDLTNHALADRAVAGPLNPAAVEISTRHEGDEAVAEVWFGPAFEGAPGRVHGGVVAAVFDDLTGYALAMVQEPGFTGRLTVSYKAPVPIETTIEFRARYRNRHGRKLHVDADARLDDTVLATAEALFILVDRDHFATRAHELLARARDRSQASS